jgi:hypothetical protein
MGLSGRLRSPTVTNVWSLRVSREHSIEVPSRRLEDRIRELCDLMINAKEDQENFTALIRELQASLARYSEPARFHIPERRIAVQYSEPKSP